jgi:hypothetical protein
MVKQSPIGTDTLVGDILRDYPTLRGVVVDLFGPDCISCRSNRHETITYTSWHKGLDPESVARILNNALMKTQQ